MPVLKASSIRDLKFRVNIHDVVARTVSLKKSGHARFKGLCPFHSEKTPSFHVSADKGFYKCFGCGKAGDILSFVMETEGLQFSEAAEALAKRHGVTLEYEEGGPTREERSLRQEIFDIHDLAADHYRHAFLTDNSHGIFIRKYWEEQRRFAPAIAEEFKIGFAPPDDVNLAATLLKKNFSPDALRQCGLFFVREGAVLTAATLRPRFRGRLMIPIRDHQGRIVAFTARQLELTPADDPAHEAKYVNSPETPIFTKSQLLFNLDRARSHVGEGRPFVLVEGQLDAIRCWSAGLQTAVAPQGTSITEGQLQLLRRYSPQVECFFDSDSAGQKAALRFLPLALRTGLEVRFLTLSGATKLDPDLLFLERGLAAYEELRRDAVGAMAFACRALQPEGARAIPHIKAQSVKAIREIIEQCESQVSRFAYAREAAPLLGIPDIAALTNDLGQHREAIASAGMSSTPGISVRRKVTTDIASRGATSTEQNLLYVCLHHEGLLQQLASHMLPEWIDPGSTAGRLLDRFLSEARHNGWPGREHLDQLLESEEEKALVATLLFDAAEEADLAKAASEGIAQLQRRHLEPRLKQIELEIASDAADGHAQLSSLLKQRADIVRQLQNPPRISVRA